jgi:glucokinase
LAIAGAAAQAAYRGEAPNLLKAVGTEVAAIRSSHLAAAVNAGDRAIEAIIRTAGEHIGIAVAAAVNLLAPEIVVLGGGLVEAMPSLFVESVSQSARDRVMPSFEQSFQIVAAALGDEASVMGAAAWAREVVSLRATSELVPGSQSHLSPET